MKPKPSAEALRAEFEEVEAALEAIRLTVRERAGYQSAVEMPRPADLSPLAAVALTAKVSSHVMLTSELPVIGGAVVYAQRVMRLLLRWYINPIVEQQNNFNEAVVRELSELESRQRRLERLLDGAGGRVEPDGAPR